MKYYTYIHKRNDTGEVFYVGKGTGRRAWWKFHEDNKKWCRIAKNGYSVEIVNRFQNELDALHDEMDLQVYYTNAGCDLANKRIVSSVGNFVGMKSRQIVKPLKAKWVDLYDIYVNMDKYNSNLELQPNGCLEQVRGAKHNQGYMMIPGVRKSDMCHMMVTGHRIAGRLKYKRALDESEFVIRTCNNPKCHNQDHITLGNYQTKHQVGPKRGIKYGIVKESIKQDRKYKYSIQDLYWQLNHEPWEIAQRWNLREGSGAKFRAKRCKWLHHFTPDGKLKPEFAHLYIGITTGESIL